MIKQFLRHNLNAWVTLIGFACALLVLEIQRMPAVHLVEFSIFAPIPYGIEAFFVLVGALLYKRNPALCHTQRKVLYLFVIGATIVSSWLVVAPISFPDESTAMVVQSLYRVASAFFFLLWGERLFVNKARKAGFLFALSCLISGGIILLLSLLDQNISRLIVYLLPVISGVCLAVSKPLVFQGAEETSTLFFEKPLPRLMGLGKKEVGILFCLIVLPLLCRGPVVSIQSVWMPFQSEGSLSFFIQLSIGLGVVFAGLILLFIVRYVWNHGFIFVYELLILPATFLAFYASQASADLWFIYLVIIDATYKVALFYIVMTPFLFSKQKNPLVFLPLSFAGMILIRALFSALYRVLPGVVFAAVSTTLVFVALVICAGFSFVVFQKNLGFIQGTKGGQKEEKEDSIVQASSLLAKRYQLTGREEEILVLLAERNRAPYIAKKLVLSQSTIKTHMKNLYAKLAVHSQTELMLLVEETSKKEKS